MITTVAGSASLDFSGGIAVDPSGDLYLTVNGGVRKVSDGIISNVVFGNACPTPISIGATAVIDNVTVDASGNLYGALTIDDPSGGCVLKLSNGVTTALAETFFDGPIGIAVDASGNNLYATDRYSIRKIADGMAITVAGTANASGFDGGPATAAVLGIDPLDIALDTFGNLYIADTSNHAIRKVSNGIITTIAGTGAPGFNGDNGPANAAQLNGPVGIAVDAAGNIYFSDSGNHRVRLLTPSGPSCSASVTPSSYSTPYSGESLTVTISTPSTCPWSVEDLPAWVASSSSAGTGTATITLTISPNTGGTRSAIVLIAGISAQVTQQSNPVPIVISPNGVVALDSTISTIQPGSWISIFGTNLATGTFVWSGDFPISLGGVSVTIDGKAGYLSFVSPSQINLQAPDDTVFGPVDVVVTTPNGSASSTASLASYAPSLSLFDSRYAAVVIPTPDGSGAYGNGAYDLGGPPGHFSFQTRPANPGEVVELYGFGFGPTNPAVAAGKVFSGAARAVLLPLVSIGGMSAVVQFCGLAAAGVYQLNVVVPNGASSGDQLVRATLGSAQTPDNVYINVH